MCDIATIKRGAGNFGEQRICTLYSFQIQLVKIPILTLGSGINLICRPEPTLRVGQNSTHFFFFWCRTCFYIHRRGKEISRIFKTISQHSRNRKEWSFLISLYLFLQVASCILRVTGSFASTVKTGANMTLLYTGTTWTYKNIVFFFSCFSLLPKKYMNE